MSNIWALEEEYQVAIIKQTLEVSEKQATIQDNALWLLEAQAMEKVKEAFKRLFGDSISFPSWEVDSAIQASWDNLRIDFPFSFDTSLKIKNIIDKDTWISFAWYETHTSSGKWISFQVRVPLKTLSPTGIEKV